MRKIMLFLAVCVALTACKKEVLTKGTPFQKGQTVTISAGAGGGSNAKVQGTDDGTNINFKWNESDEIKVTVGGASSIFRLKTGAGTGQATFEGTMPASGTTFDIQYPVDDPDLSNQDYVAGGIQKGLVKFTANNCTLNSAADLTVASAILKLKFTGSEAVTKIVVETVEHTPAKSYTLNISGVTLSSTPTTFLMVAEPMTAKLKITLYNGSNVINSFTTSTEQNLTPGGCLTMPEKPVLPECLCFTALEAGCTVFMEDAEDWGYSNNGQDWESLKNVTITLQNIGDKVYIKAQREVGDLGYDHRFTTSGKLKVSGNVMYLLKPNDPGTTIQIEDCFADLFSDCSIVDASGLLLPATTLTNRCYARMFSGCTNLTAAPALPADNLAEECYLNMFASCTNLTTAPALPATNLAEYCYASMFASCTNLTTAPALPATTLKESCYSGMFFNSGLTAAPALPADNLAEECYSSMFQRCTNLTEAPALPANVLAASCYSMMFYQCDKLNNVTMLATNVSANDCLFWWLNNAGTSVSGTKYVHVASGMASTIQSTLPSGWTATEAR